MIIELITLVISIFILSESSAIVIDSAVKLSRFFNISQVAIGFLLISVATTMPELSVSLASSSAGQSAISAGNAFGSVIANILIILGIGGLLFGIRISSKNMKEAAAVLLLTTLISLYIIYNSSVQEKVLSSVEGFLLLACFCGYVVWVLKTKRVENGEEQKLSKRKALDAFVLFVLGVIGVIVSAGFAVDLAILIADMMGLAKSFIGATIIAVGTSLPELGTALQGLRKRHYGLVFGNVIGSNMSNLTLVLGTASVISPITVQIPIFIAALIFAVLANSLLFYASAINKGLRKFGGIVFILTYVVYLIMISSLQASELKG